MSTHDTSRRRRTRLDEVRAALSAVPWRPRGFFDHKDWRAIARLRDEGEVCVVRNPREGSRREKFVVRRGFEDYLTLKRSIGQLTQDHAAEVRAVIREALSALEGITVDGRGVFKETTPVRATVSGYPFFDKRFRYAGDPFLPGHRTEFLLRTIQEHGSTGRYRYRVEKQPVRLLRDLEEEAKEFWAKFDEVHATVTNCMKPVTQLFDARKGGKVPTEVVVGVIEDAMFVVIADKAPASPEGKRGELEWRVTTSGTVLRLGPRTVREVHSWAERRDWSEKLRSGLREAIPELGRISQSPEARRCRQLLSETSSGLEELKDALRGILEGGLGEECRTLREQARVLRALWPVPDVQRVEGQAGQEARRREA